MHSANSANSSTKTFLGGNSERSRCWHHSESVILLHLYWNYIHIHIEKLQSSFFFFGNHRLSSSFHQTYMALLHWKKPNLFWWKRYLDLLTSDWHQFQFCTAARRFNHLQALYREICLITQQYINVQLHSTILSCFIHRNPPLYIWQIHCQTKSEKPCCKFCMRSSCSDTSMLIPASAHLTAFCTTTLVCLLYIDPLERFL